MYTFIFAPPWKIFCRRLCLLVSRLQWKWDRNGLSNMETFTLTNCHRIFYRLTSSGLMVFVIQISVSVTFLLITSGMITKLKLIQTCHPLENHGRNSKCFMAAAKRILAISKLYRYLSLKNTIEFNKLEALARKEMLK